MKYIIFLLSLCSFFVLINSTVYMPMTKRTINFGDDVCHYKDISHSSDIEYVKPCEEGKICSEQLIASNYGIYTCQPYEVENYDNKEDACEVDISCTYEYSCMSGKCNVNSCPAGQVRDPSATSFTCINEPTNCEEYTYSPYAQTKAYTPGINKECIEIELQSDTNNKNYEYVKVKFNSIASIEDGKFIKDDDNNNILYCKNGYALYFYGNQKLKNPKSGDIDASTEKMFLRCVTVLGRDQNGIIKYKIGEGSVMYYDYRDLPYNPARSQQYQLINNNKYLMTRLEIFDKYKKRLESISDCKELNCDDDELNKWYYFYFNPQEYILYQNEPQIMEYLIQSFYSKYKAKHTSPNESSRINIKYLALLSLLLLL